MATKQPANRVEIALEQWKRREERFMQLFPIDLDKDLHHQKEKLHYLERLQRQFGTVANDEERLSLVMVQSQVKRLSVQLYPSFWQRLFRVYVVAFLHRDLGPAVVIELKASSSESVAASMQKAGFKDFIGQTQHQMNMGTSQFSIPVSYYIGQDKMDFELRHVSDDGRYRMTGYQATLQLAYGEKRTRFFNSETESGINAHQAYNLLSGRSVCLDASTERWVKLDFNDADAAGNCKLRYYRTSETYELGSQLKEWPIVRLVSGKSIDRLVDDLCNGDRVDVVLGIAGVEKIVSLEASPQSHGVKVLNQAEVVVSRAEALGSPRAVTAARNQVQPRTQHQPRARHKR